MGIQHHYEPCFANVPEDPSGRWLLLREFVSRWHNLNLPFLRDAERAASVFEYVIDRTLPESFREWISFSEDLQALNAFDRVLRDEFDVSRLSRCFATTLMLQGEGDVYWAIRDQDSAIRDPPVNRYHLDDNDMWIHGGIAAESLTSFVLGHMAYFLGAGFARSRDIGESLIQEMEASFPVVTNFDDLRVFEMTDLISFVRKCSTDNYLLVVARKDGLPESAIPDCLRRWRPSLVACIHFYADEAWKSL